MTREIQLTKGKVALVDDEDYEWLSQYNWFASFNKERNRWVAQRHITLENGERTTILMHREIMGAKPGEKVDHIDRDALHNYRSNLRFSTNAQNLWNSMSRGGSSKYKGVCWHKRRRKWQAQITAGGIRIHLGYFTNEEDAARAYDAAAREKHEESGRYNFPEPGERSALILDETTDSTNEHQKESEVQTLKQHVMRLYDVTENDQLESIASFLDRLGDQPAFSYPVATAELTMYRLSWAAEAIHAGLFDEYWTTDIEPQVNKNLAKTSYTNVAGD